MLVITEAFEEDTGRYCCVASNSVGSNSTSAEVFVEGKYAWQPREEAKYVTCRGKWQVVVFIILWGF